MVSIKKKKISGKEYYYLSKSIRLPNGKVDTIEKKVKDQNVSASKYTNWFDEEEKKLFGSWAIKHYAGNSIFTKEQMQKIEAIRVDYKKILRKLSKAQKKDLFDRFTVNFTYESNALEGNSLTLKDVAIVLFEKMFIKGKELREIYETRNSREVVDLIIKKKFKITEKDIIKIHKVLIKDMEITKGYKQIPNFILDRNVKTSLPEKVPEEMQKLIEYYEKNKSTMHPLQLAANLHGMFEKIHPFDDGNGRVGRFLINIILTSNKYPPLIIRKTQRQAYFKCLQDFDNGYTTNLERFLLEKYKDTYKKFFEIYVKYLK